MLLYFKPPDVIPSLLCKAARPPPPRRTGVLLRNGRPPVTATVAPDTIAGHRIR